MYTVITVILNANGFAIGSVVSLKQSHCILRKSKFIESVEISPEHTAIPQVNHMIMICL